MPIFKALAETIADRQFFDIDEVADLIRIYFEFHHQDILNDDICSNNIVRRRNSILSKLRDIEIAKNVIEKQLLVAKSKLREGHKIDTVWMAKANFAFRIKKSQLVSFKNDLTNLKSYERSENIKKANLKDRLVNIELFKLLKNKLGELGAISIFEEAESIAGYKRTLD